MFGKKAKLEGKPKPDVHPGATKGTYMGNDDETYSEFLFLNRKHYRDNIFNSFVFANLKTHSFWDGDKGRLYGRVNFNGDSVFLSEANLNQISGTDDTFFALKPVVDAFEDLKDYVREYKSKLGSQLYDQSKDENILLEIIDTAQPAFAWQSFFVAYTDHLELISTSFIDSFMGPVQERKITGFKTFFEEYYTAAKIMARKSILTPTAFLRSPSCPVNSSGLIIDLLPLEHGEDSPKHFLINSDSFVWFMKAAKKFGFIIDKNAPWRLIADIFSTPMRKYMAVYGVPFGKDTMFEEFYTDLNFFELNYMRHYIVDQYNKYVQSRPTISIYQPGTKSKNKRIDDLSYGYHKTIPRTIIREPVQAFDNTGQFDTNSKFAQKYNELFWLRFYYDMRLLEEKKEVSLSRFNEQFKDVVRYYRIHGQAKTVRAINRELNMNLRIF
jgi:hypothetical protein